MSDLSFNPALWVPLLLGLGVGLGAMLICWLLLRSMTVVPPEDRSYRDAPPSGFRLLWWPIRWLAHHIAPRLSDKLRTELQTRLRLAGLDFALLPEQLLAAKCVGGLLAAAVAAWLLQAFGLRPGWGVLLAGLGGYAFPSIWLRDRTQLRKRDTLKTLPFMLDIITLCVEAGLNLNGALAQAVAKGPAGPLRDEFSRVLRDVRAGRPRLDALRTLADRMNEPAITNFVSALVTAERMGMNLGPILRAQAEQRRSERFARAEKLAMEAPVKMLFPLIAFIFPCTFVVIGFPIAMKFLHMGL